MIFDEEGEVDFDEINILLVDLLLEKPQYFEMEKFDDNINCFLENKKDMISYLKNIKSFISDKEILVEYILNMDTISFSTYKDILSKFQILEKYKIPKKKIITMKSFLNDSPSDFLYRIFGNNMNSTSGIPFQENINGSILNCLKIGLKFQVVNFGHISINNNICYIPKLSDIDCFLIRQVARKKNIISSYLKEKFSVLKILISNSEDYNYANSIKVFNSAILSYPDYVLVKELLGETTEILKGSEKYHKILQILSKEGSTKEEKSYINYNLYIATLVSIFTFLSLCISLWTAYETNRQADYAALSNAKN